MPQLSPLNWIMLYILFWSAVLCVSILLWWSSKIFFSSETSSSMKEPKENKWNW
uniref:ATP synthase complex subunit 8 n=1 Tax=Drupella rugosa TaxID=1029760 RepID=A0A8K1XXD5_9CAEN|nr:ATP synthase F0 subunit 8 [Drupella rugosa]YP_010400245.1 ATP synthase F0 subunit 8 [Drupella margariticola]UHM24784.1 ATP synthase F0 subunit 8 [Drupella rugosa]UQS75944.1 ATP synthase F0 subunit 8 [Drupella margariticola]